MVHASAVLLKPWAFGASLSASSSPSFLRSKSPKLFPDDPEAAAPKGLLLPLKALKALFTAPVAEVDAGVVPPAAAPNGEGEPKLGLPNTEVEAGDPNDAEPKVGVEDPSLLAGVVEPTGDWPKKEEEEVGVVPGFWKNGDDEGVVVVAENAPNPGWSLLNPDEDVAKFANAPPVGGAAAGVVVAGAGVDGFSSADDLTGGVAGGVAAANAGFAGEGAGDVGVDGVADGVLAVNPPLPNALVVLFAPNAPNADLGGSLLVGLSETPHTGFASLLDDC